MRSSVPLELVEARVREELVEMSLARARQERLALGVRIELAHHLPEEAQRPSVPGVIPDARRDDAARPRDARRLAQPADRIGHEVDDELCERQVEGGGLERQVLGGRALDGHAWMPPRAAATNGSEGSTAVTDSGPSRCTSSVVSAPGPQPTSSARCPAETPAKSASSGANGSVPPMKRSYASAATVKLMRPIFAER